MTHDLNVLALFKGAERFIFVYDDASRDEVITAVRDAAADPAVALNWFDAAVLTERAKQQAKEAAEQPDHEHDRLPSRTEGRDTPLTHPARTPWRPSNKVWPTSSPTSGSRRTRPPRRSSLTAKT